MNFGTKVKTSIRQTWMIAAALAGMACGDLAALTESVEQQQSESEQVAQDAVDKDTADERGSKEANGNAGAPARDDVNSDSTADEQQGVKSGGGANEEPAAPGAGEPETDQPMEPSETAAKPTAPETEYNEEAIHFSMAQPKSIVDAACAPSAKGEVVVRSEGTVDVMEVSLSGLPPKTLFGLFLTQVPNFPFGISWYQGEMETDAYGAAKATFIGRFNLEVFAVAPDTAAAPQLHAGDAAANERTAPVHTFHLGLWFDSADDAAREGCPDVVTPFNGEHNAGVQVLNTANFADEAGPLSQLQ